MSSDNKPENAIITECDLNEGPDKVWRALTEPDLVARWLVPDDIDCRVMEADPERLLRCSWKGREDERDSFGQSLDTVVTFELTPTQAGGTHLRIVHEGFARAALDAANDNQSLMMRAA